MSTTSTRIRTRTAFAAAAVLAMALAGCGETPGSGGSTSSQTSGSSSQTSAGDSSSPSSPSGSSTGTGSNTASTGAPSGTSSTGSTPTTGTSPSPTANPNALLPGTNHSRAASAYAYPAKDVQGWLEHGSKAPRYPTKKIAFMTFDDGPDRSISLKNLATLKKYNAHGTFFDVGQELGGDTANSIVRQQVAAGNSICLHSNSHDYHYLYPGRAGNATHVLTDYKKVLAKMRAALGPNYTDRCYRYPGGHMSWNKMASSDAALAAQGAAWVDWNVMTGDAEPKKVRPTSAAGAVTFLKKQIATISGKRHVLVILMHDTKKITSQALPSVIQYLRSAGYEFGVIG